MGREPRAGPRQTSRWRMWREGAITYARSIRRWPRATLTSAWRTRRDTGSVVNRALGRTASPEAGYTARQAPHTPPSDTVTVAACARHYVVFGLTPLACAVVEWLRQEEPSASVAVVPGAPKQPAELAALPDGVEVIDHTLGREKALRHASLQEAACLLSLTDDPVENLRTIVAAWEIDRTTEVVIDTFDQALAERMEREGLGWGWEYDRVVHRAFGEASLAAPYFAVKAFAGDNLVTLRFIDQQVAVSCLPVIKQGGMDGQEVGAVEERFEVVVIAVRDGQRWKPPSANQELRTGDVVVVSGLDSQVVWTAQANMHPSLSLKRELAAPRGVFPSVASWLADAGGRSVLWLSRRPERIRHWRREIKRRRPGWYRLTWGLLPLMLLTVVVVGLADQAGGDLVDWGALLTQVTLGEEDFEGFVGNEGFKLPGLLGLFLGTALVAVLTSQLAAAATKERVDPEASAERRARHLRDHVVVAGLGELGYRISRLLRLSGVECAVVSPVAEDRFSGAAGSRAPLLTGSIRLEENLFRANLGSATALIACSDDSLSNIEAGMRAHRLSKENREPLRIVTRVFSDGWAVQAAEGFGVEEPMISADVAAKTYAQAAADLSGRHRIEFQRADDRPPLEFDGRQLYAARLRVSAQGLSEEDMAAWRRQGLRPVALGRQEEGREEQSASASQRDAREAAPQPDQPEPDSDGSEQATPKTKTAARLSSLRGGKGPKKRSSPVPVFEAALKGGLPQPGDEVLVIGPKGEIDQALLHHPYRLPVSA